MRLFLGTAVVLATILGFGELSKAQTKLYWTDPNLNVIKRSNPDGSDVETILSTNQDFAYITASPSQGKIFYTVGSPTPQLWSMGFDGESPQLLATFDGSTYTRGLAIDDPASTLFWTSSSANPAGNGKVRSANTNGSNVTNVLSLSDTYPYSMAVDPSAGKMYWIDTGSEDRIERANLDGSGRQTIVSGSVGFTSQLAIDTLGSKLYWIDPEHGFVYRSNLDGTSQQTIGTVSIAADDGIAVDGLTGKVFWSDTQLDRIYSANLDGSSKVAIVSTNLSYPMSLALVTVPEPSSILLGALAFASLLVLRQSEACDFGRSVAKAAIR